MMLTPEERQQIKEHFTCLMERLDDPGGDVVALYLISQAATNLAAHIQSVLHGTVDINK